LNNKKFLKLINFLVGKLIPIWETGKPPHNEKNWGPHYTFPNSERPVSVGLIEAFFLHNITKLINAKSGFEIGSGFGYSSWWIGHALRSGEWFGSIDNYSEGSNHLEKIKFITFAKETLELGNTHYYNGTSPSDLKKIIGQKELDIVFIDGHHYQDAPLSDFKEILNFVNEKSIIVMHDIQDKYTVNKALDYANEINWQIEYLSTSCGMAVVSKNEIKCKINKAYYEAQKLKLLN